MDFVRFAYSLRLAATRSGALPFARTRRRATERAPLRVAANLRLHCPLDLDYHDLVIVGYHVIFSTYGFWLPNDPRGSWSDFVGSWELLRYGPATKTTQRRSLAYDQHDRNLRKAAKSALM